MSMTPEYFQHDIDALDAELKVVIRDLAYQIVAKDALLSALRRIAEECHQWQASEFSLRVCEIAERALVQEFSLRACEISERALVQASGAVSLPAAVDPSAEVPGTRSTREKDLSS
jgi:hypothetical protein